MKKAMMKIKASLTNNVGIKVIAVVIAALIWLMIVNISDPEKTVIIYNIPINVTHEEVITDMNMVYDSDKNATVNITVSGKRSVVSKLSAEDFTATASLKELSKVNAIPVQVSAVQNYIGRKITIEKQSKQTLEVSIEQVKKQNYSVSVEYNGSPEEGYVAGGYTLSKNMVTVKAPESLLDKIDRVVARCDIDGENEDFTTKSRLYVYDKHDNILKSDKIKLSSKRVSVSVTILNEKQVPIETPSVGTPETGYHVGKVTVSPENITLIGKKEVLDTVEKLVISDTINISGKTTDTVEKINIRKYLPEGTDIGQGEMDVISVVIKINKLVSKKFTINTDKIAIDGLNNSYEMAFVSKNINVELQGKDDVIKKITLNDIGASINLNNYKEGTETVNVSVTLPDGAALVNDVRVRVKISKKK